MHTRIYKFFHSLFHFSRLILSLFFNNHVIKNMVQNKNKVQKKISEKILVCHNDLIFNSLYNVQYCLFYIEYNFNKRVPFSKNAL